MIALVEFERECRTVPPALYHYVEIKQQEEDSEDVDNRLRARSPTLVEKIHSHVDAVFEAACPSENVVCRHCKLRHFHNPDYGAVNCVRHDGIQQQTHHHKQQIHCALADEFAEFSDIANIQPNQLHRGHARVFAYFRPIDRIEPVVDVVESRSSDNHKKI